MVLPCPVRSSAFHPEPVSWQPCGPDSFCRHVELDPFSHYFKNLGLEFLASVPKLRISDNTAPAHHVTVIVGSPYQPGRQIYTSVDTTRQNVGVSTSRYHAWPSHLYLWKLSPPTCLTLTPTSIFLISVVVAMWGWEPRVSDARQTLNCSASHHPFILR